MVAIANPLPVTSRLKAGEAFLAADVGGTHVRVGLVQAGDAGQPVQVLEYQKYACAQYPGLKEILAAFLQSLPGVDVQRGVIASAGFPLADGTVITANLPWPLAPARIARELGLTELRLVNDFEAVAHAAAHVDASQVLQLTGPAQAPKGPLLILGPGTGLGAAVWIPARPRPVVLPTEAGQAALPAGNAEELALVGHMLQQRPHVPVEHALSGPGLLNLYQAHCALAQATPRFHAPGEITAAALEGSDALALRTLHSFCGFLGSIVGDMALLYGIQGGVYLAGGILPQIKQFLPQSTFVARFLNKGPMRAALETLPVKLVEHGQLGVVGAASWYLDEVNAD